MNERGLLLIFENKPTSILAEKLFQQLDAEEYNTLFALLEENEELEKINKYSLREKDITKSKEKKKWQNLAIS